MADGVAKVTARELLRRREKLWAPLLRRVSLAAEAEIRVDHSTQAATALGMEYGKAVKAGRDGLEDLLTTWPACLVAAMTGVAIDGWVQGSYWPTFWKTAKYPGNSSDQKVWGGAFARAVAEFGLPTFPGTTTYTWIGPVLMHSGIPKYCLGDFFRLLAKRRRLDPGLDADGFLAWATGSGRDLRLSQLDKPAERFLRGGGDYAHDVVELTLVLLDRLADPDSDLDSVGLPAYMIQEARAQIAAGRLDVSGMRASTLSSGGRTIRQARPRIALDPYGAGVHVLLPAVGDMPDGTAHWRVTADGKTGTVQSRAMWVGVAEAAPETSYPLNRPVRTVLVALGGREDLAAELQVIDPNDPVLFFAEDGHRLASAVSLPRSRVWIMHPEDRDLNFVGQTGPIDEPSLPFGWYGWRLLHVSLQNIQSVCVGGGRPHQVESQARPQLMHGDPVPGVATPYGSPVYPVAPPVLLPQGAEGIIWHVEVRRVGDSAPLASRDVVGAGEVDIWRDVPRPLLGAFEVTVRGPLGRGLRRTIVLAEGLSASYQPLVRLLDGVGLGQGRASLNAASGAVVSPTSLRFGPDERSHHFEYRTDTETEPMVVTPPHAGLLCPGAGVTTWTTSLLHLVTEEFATAGRLLVRLPDGGPTGRSELEIYVSGQRVQAVPASGQQSAGLIGFELDRAADTIAAYGLADLVLNAGGTAMPVGRVRPRRLASGADLDDGLLVLREAAAVEGLTAGVYLAYAPWRPPVELPVDRDGIAVLPESLANAGPLLVLPRVEDPWVPTAWPVWPDAAAHTIRAAGTPVLADPEEEELARFVAGVESELPALTSLGRLWRLVNLAAGLVKLGARADLATRCVEELLRRPRAALLALVDEEFSGDGVAYALIRTGLAAAPADPKPWTSAEERALERLWAAFPVAAAIASGPLLADPETAGAAVSQCGESLVEILAGEPDPFAGVGRLGPEAEMMATWPLDQVNAMWQAAAVVPQTLLYKDTRLMAAWRMFDARNTPALRAAATVAESVTLAAEEIIDESHTPGLTAPIAARWPADGASGWLALPAMSIAMALAARLAARGHVRCAALEREYRGKWASLALHAPDLVTIDLVRAEAMVVGAFNEKPE